jgi:polyisoprenoid-binding protein YceI
LQNAKIEFNLWGELFETDKTGWNESIKIKIKRMLESYDSKDKKVYLILRQFLDVQQYKDANFKTYKIVINSVQKDVNETLESDE